MVVNPLWGKVMKRLPVVRHLSAERAEARYRACKHPIEKVRWHAIRLLLRTDPVRTPAQVTEPLWPLVRDRVGYLAEHPDEVQPRVGFRWAVGLEQ